MGLSAGFLDNFRRRNPLLSVNNGDEEHTGSGKDNDSCSIRRFRGRTSVIFGSGTFRDLGVSIFEDCGTF